MFERIPPLHRVQSRARETPEEEGIGGQSRTRRREGVELAQRYPGVTPHCFQVKEPCQERHLLTCRHVCLAGAQNSKGGQGFGYFSFKILFLKF